MKKEDGWAVIDSHQADFSPALDAGTQTRSCRIEAIGQYQANGRHERRPQELRAPTQVRLIVASRA